MTNKGLPRGRSRGNPARRPGAPQIRAVRVPIPEGAASPETPIAHVVNKDGITQPVPTPMSWTIAPQDSGQIAVIISHVCGQNVFFLHPDYVKHLIGQLQDALNVPKGGLVVAPAGAIKDAKLIAAEIAAGKRG